MCSQGQFRGRLLYWILATCLKVCELSEIARAYLSCPSRQLSLSKLMDSLPIPLKTIVSSDLISSMSLRDVVLKFCSAPVFPVSLSECCCTRSRKIKVLTLAVLFSARDLSVAGKREAVEPL